MSLSLSNTSNNRGMATTRKTSFAEKSDKKQRNGAFGRQLSIVLMFLTVSTFRSPGLVVLPRAESTASSLSNSDTNGAPAASNRINVVEHVVVGEDDERIPVSGDSGRTYNVTASAARQIRHYRNGTGLIVNCHITHHGGKL